jgi:hypothetical protein
MSKLKKEIIEKATLIKASSNPIIDSERNQKLMTVLIASEIDKKPVSVLALTKLLKRMATPLTDEEIDKIKETAKITANEIKDLDKAERANWDKSHCMVPGDKYPDILYRKSLTEDGGEIIIDINHPEVCKYIISQLHTVSFNDTLYVYGNDGVYREDVNEVNSIVVDILYDRFLRQKEATSVRDIVIALKGMNRHTEYPFDMPGDVFLVENGAVNISGGQSAITPAFV